MKKIVSLVFALILITPLFLIAQDKNEELIDWRPGNKLTWADYKGSPNPASDAAASTTTHLGIEYNIRNSDFTYTIRNAFSKTRSWGRHKDDYILAHEQGHFDIAEVFARKLHKEMAAYKFSRSSFRTDLKKIYDTVLDEKEATQNQYDEETRHSINKEKQAEWIKKIAAMLNDLAKYADYTVHS